MVYYLLLFKLLVRRVPLQACNEDLCEKQRCLKLVSSVEGVTDHQFLHGSEETWSSFQLVNLPSSLMNGMVNRYAYLATVVQCEKVVQQWLHVVWLAAQFRRHEPGDKLRPVPDG